MWQQPSRDIRAEISCMGLELIKEILIRDVDLYEFRGVGEEKQNTEEYVQLSNGENMSRKLGDHGITEAD